MSSNDVSSIEIIKQIEFFGEGDTLESRLRNVSLRGFDHIAIYKKASIKSVRLTPQDIQETLYTPQPHLHQEYLDRVMQLAKLFLEKGIDIFHLEYAYDYVARSTSGEETTWTMLPPVVERMTIPQHTMGGFDYAPIIDKELKESLRRNDWEIEPATRTMAYHNTTDRFNLINDGSHRIHAGFESDKGTTVLEISDMTPGFPYYAAPQHYSTVRVFKDSEESEDLKVHVIASPGQKQLYRLFPSGGIMSGGVRPQRTDEVFI